MSEVLHRTVDKLPEILAKNAPAMIQRMIAAIQTEIGTDLHLENAAYCSLVLKMSANDLSREFAAAVTENMLQIRNDIAKPGIGAAISLSIEPLDGEPVPAADDFASADSAFHRIVTLTESRGIRGMKIFSKAPLLESLQTALHKSRIEAPVVEKLMPFARRALSRELASLYEKMAAM